MAPAIKRSSKLIVLAIFTLIAVIPPFSGYSQPITQSGGMAYSMFGSSHLDIGTLNSRLESRGYASLSENFLSSGMGVHWIYKNGIILGGEGQFLWGDEISGREYRHSVNAWYGFLDVGYNLVQYRQLRLYPLIGFGGGIINLKISKNLSGDSFDQVLDNPGRQAKLWTGGFLLNFALGTDYFLVLGSDKKGKGGLAIGLRAGYTLSPVKSGWVMDDIDIPDSPKTGLPGPYIRIILGGGGFIQKSDS